MPAFEKLDARARPPQSIQNAYKKLQKLKATDDLQGPPAMTPDSDLVEMEPHSIAELPSHLRQVFLDFLQANGVRVYRPNGQEIPPFEPGKVLQVAHVPGKLISSHALFLPLVLHVLLNPVSRPLHLPLPPLAPSATASPASTPPPRPKQPLAPHKRRPALRRTTAISHILLPPQFFPGRLPASRSRGPQTHHEPAVPYQETPLDHPRRPVRLDRETLPSHFPATVPGRHQTSC